MVAAKISYNMSVSLLIQSYLSDDRSTPINLRFTTSVGGAVLYGRRSFPAERQEAGALDSADLHGECKLGSTSLLLYIF